MASSMTGKSATPAHSASSLEPAPVAPAASHESAPMAAGNDAPAAPTESFATPAGADAPMPPAADGQPDDFVNAQAAESGAAPDSPASVTERRPRPSGSRTWEGFVEFVTAQNGNGFVTGLMQAKGELCDAELVLTCHNETHIHMMEEGDNNTRLRRLVAEYFGPDVTVAFVCPEHAPLKTEGALQREMQDHPLVRRVRETFECRDPALVVPRR